MEITNKGKSIKIVKKADLSQSGVLTINSIMQNISALYTLEPDQAETVNGFLKTNPFLVPILIEAKPQLERFFGKAKVRLELDVDHEEGWPELFGMVEVNLPVDKALSLLHQFQQEWFSNVDRRIFMKLNFDVEIIDEEYLQLAAIRRPRG